MKRVKRFCTLKLDGKAERTPQGFLRIPATITRTGVLKYMRNGKPSRELHLPEEIFRTETMDSLKGAPLTFEHPSDGLVTPENARKHMIGFIADNVRKVDEELLGADVIITDADAIKRVEEGKIRELSGGYLCEHDDSSGTFEGESYDLVHRNIMFNHVALTRKGRAGGEVALQLDSDDAVQVENDETEEKKGMKITLGGKEFEVSDELGAAIQAAMAEQDSLKAKADQFGAEAKKAAEEKEKAEAKADSLESENKKLKADSAASPEKIQAAVKARRNLEAVAERMGVEKFDTMSDVELKKAVITKDSADASFDGKSDAYVDARFDLVAEKSKTSEAAAKKLGAGFSNKGSKGSEVKTDSTKARETAMERASKAWQEDLSATKK